MSQFIVRGHWDGRINRIDGDSFESHADALSAIAFLMGCEPGDLVTVVVDGDSMHDEIVYPDQDAADRDENGASPGSACATIEERADGWTSEDAS